jgi:hypothetical protein
MRDRQMCSAQREMSRRGAVESNGKGYRRRRNTTHSDESCDTTDLISVAGLRSAQSPRDRPSGDVRLIAVLPQRGNWLVGLIS